METGYKASRQGPETLELREDRFGSNPSSPPKVRVVSQAWRVNEVGVPPHRRTYAEAKKIEWRDGLSSFCCVLRYSPAGERSHAGLSVGASDGFKVCEADTMGHAGSPLR